MGESERHINQQVNIFKAKELAEAVLAAARAQVTSAAGLEKEEDRGEDKKGGGTHEGEVSPSIPCSNQMGEGQEGGSLLLFLHFMKWKMS